MDIVVYGTAAWNAPWLTEHNLAHALARRHRVLYVEPTISPLSPLRYGRRSLGRLPSLLRRRRGADRGLRVLSPLAFPPLTHPRAAALSTPLVARQIRRAARSLGFRRPVVIAARPMLEVRGAASEALTVFLMKDWVEAGGSLLGVDPEELRGSFMGMCEAADLVCATSAALQETLRARGIESALLRHGFGADLAPLYHDPQLPERYHGLPGRRLGYTGRIDGRLDFALLEKISTSFSKDTLVLVGPLSPRLEEPAADRLMARPNVIALGRLSRERLPAYISHLDCALMPYRPSEWARHGAPLKLWDYLYAGPPPVGSGCSVLLEYPSPLVRYSDDHEGFLGAMEEAMAADGGEAHERRDYALANTWDHRAAHLEGLIGRLGP